MKKSTILIIVAVFLISVFVVGIFGLQSIPYEQRVYIEQITPTSITLNTGAPSPKIKLSQNGYYIVTIPRDHYEEGMGIIISYDICPTDATNKNLDVTIDNSLNTNSNGVWDERGWIVLNDSGTIDVIFKAKDQQGGATMTVRIRVSG